MDGSEDPAGRLRRLVLVLLLVVGVVTAGFALVATRPADEPDRAEDEANPSEVVTATREAGSEPSLRRRSADEMLVAGRLGDPVAQPENTAESFAAAIDGGADLVEADVVMSQDGQLVVRSSNQLEATTDVADRPEFADRERTKSIDGEEVEDWFTEDFTLDELRTLRAVEPDPGRRPESAARDGDYAVIGFDDLLDQVEASEQETGTAVGVIVRPLRPSYFRSNGLAIEPALVKALRDRGLQFDPGRVTVESPDEMVLQRIEDSLGPNVFSAYVVTADRPDDLSAGSLAALSDTIDAVAVEVGAFTGGPAGACALGERIHDEGMAFMVFPVSYENALLPAALQRGTDPGAPGRLDEFVRNLRDVGTDVLLAESPTEVVEAVAEVAVDPRFASSKC